MVAFSKRFFTTFLVAALTATSCDGFTFNPCQTTRLSRTSSSLHSSNDDDSNLLSQSNALPDRRSMLDKSAKSLASLLVLGTVGSSPALADIKYNAGQSATPKTIVITGSNSGIGYDAAKRMVAQDAGHTVILACRTLEKATDAANRIQEELTAANGGFKGVVIPKKCDLADLSSVDAFVQDFANDDKKKIDVLCLNAGIARNTAAKDVLRSKQGFELTIGTNHLGHFYLTNKLMPVLERNKGSHIVVTASSVHDPDSPGGAQGSKATLGSLEGLEKAVVAGDGIFDMVDGGSYDPDKAYKDSKLCNIFFMRELQKRLDDKGSDITVNAFTPGLIVSTGLFRDQNPVFTKVSLYIHPKVSRSIFICCSTHLFIFISDIRFCSDRLVKSRRKYPLGWWCTRIHDT